MQLGLNNFNISEGHAALDSKREKFASKKFNNSPSFTGLADKADDIALDVLDAARRRYRGELAAAASRSIGQKAKDGFLGFFSNAKTKCVQFFKEYISEGTDVTYTNRKLTLDELKSNFGDTFEDCFEAIKDYNTAINSPYSNKFGNFVHNKFQKNPHKKDKFILVNNPHEDTITFHKDPFLKNVCEGIKEFTVGTILDLCIAGRNLYRKASAKFGSGEIIASTNKNGSFFTRILDNRIAEKKARDAFYKISGVFEKVQDGVSSMTTAKSKLLNPEQNTIGVRKSIHETIVGLAKNSIGKASEKVGKYNTKSERAWNRLGTGFVSACFASRDFYNISMLQNNDPNKANASKSKRFWQDMRRQGLTAGITYVILGAFQNKVNKSLGYAVMSLAGVTLISELLSRIIGGIPLTPLSPEEAKKLAEKKEKKAQSETGNNAPQTQNNTPAPNTSADIPVNTTLTNRGAFNPFAVTSAGGDVFNTFTKGMANSSPASTSFTSNAQTQEKPKEEKKKSSIIKKVAMGALGVVGFSLGIGLLRSKNVLGIDDAIKAMGAKYNDAIEKATRKRLILSKDDVDGFLEYLSKNNFNEQHDELIKLLDFARNDGTLTGQAAVVRKFLPQKEINPNGYYYDFGWVESKGKKTAVDLLLYIPNTISKLIKNGNNFIKQILFGIKAETPKDPNADRKMAVEFIEKYAAKYKNALCKDGSFAFRKDLENAFSRHFSEANSQNKNTSLAMISRFLITIISGYFFVNDYRNEVLIESKGEDIERANATAKERVGHKVANFFLNSMFMDLFNTTFENIYLGSVAGATAVAMATEVTNETVVRASICTPTSKMTREELIEYENKRLNDPGLKGDYYRAFMKLTGKKPLSEKAKKN